MESKLWEDVQVGDRLPTLKLPITLKTFILAVVGERDFNPVHHNSSFARSSTGNADMWLNTMWHQGLFGRFVTDWTGPDSDFRSIWLHMVEFIHPGDTLTVEGEVVGVSERGGDHLVEIDISARTQRAAVACAGAVLAMPSNAGGPVRVLDSFEKPTVEVDPELPDFARPWIGQQSDPLWSPYPVSEVQIMYWCEMVEDGNPLYIDGPYARQGRHEGVIAPPQSLFTWTMGRPGHFGDPFERPDPDNPAAKPWPTERTLADGRSTSDRLAQTLMAGGWQPPGTSKYAAQRVVQEYGRPLRPGDRVYTRAEVANCTPRKRTRLGEGHFVTLLTSFYNQRDELVGTSQYSFFFYESAEGIGAPKAD